MLTLVYPLVLLPLRFYQPAELTRLRRLAPGLSRSKHARVAVATASRSAIARLTAFTIARSDAVDDARMEPDAPDRVVVDVRLDVGRRGRVGARGHRVLVVVADADRDPELPLERLDERGDRPVAAARQLLRLAVDEHLRDDPVLLGAPVRVRDELVGPGVREVVLVERREELVGGQLVAAGVGDRLHLLREVDLQAARQLEVVLGLHQVGDAALARLRVDADDRLVGAADVHRVDRRGTARPRAPSPSAAARTCPS